MDGSSFLWRIKMAYTDISICSNALLKIGAESITSFLDGTAEAEVAANLYPMIRDGLLASYPWSFAVGQKSLPRLAGVPLADYSYAYRLPNDFLRVLSAGSGRCGRGIEYRIVENRLHTGASEVNLTYIFRPHESLFPAYFCELLIARLASEFCLPLTESTTRSEYLQKTFQELEKRTRLTDAQQSTPQRFEDFSLVEARQ